MDETIIAVIACTGTTIGFMIGLFIWLRTEASADRREMHAIQRQDRQELIGIMNAIKEDMKDYHARLCVIEAARHAK